MRSEDEDKVSKANNMVLKWSDGEQPTEILEYWSIGKNLFTNLFIHHSNKQLKKYLS